MSRSTMTPLWAQRVSLAREDSRASWARAGGLLALLAVASTGCLSPTDTAAESNKCPTTDNFPLVSQLLERRCGTMDCHGQPGRSFRIYGRYGLRKPTKATPDGYVSGGLDPTTAEEQAANYHSACGLEPEEMNLVVTHKADVGTLTLVRKPRLTEAHKGGRVLPESSNGDKCLTSWLKGAVNTAACDAELIKP